MLSSYLRLFVERVFLIPCNMLFVRVGLNSFAALCIKGNSKYGKRTWSHDGISEVATAHHKHDTRTVDVQQVL